MITITKSSPSSASAGSVEVACGSGNEIARLHEQFEERHCVQIPQLLGPPVFDEIARQVAGADFKPIRHEEFQFGHAEGEEDVGFVEASMDEHTPAFALLHFLVNDPRLFEAVRKITGCDRIGRFDGRVYRMDPGAYSGWHDDIGDGRMIAMSINLGREPYTGGVLSVREKASQEVLHEAPNRGPGDAILFQVADNLEHRITPVEGSVSKLAFAGWFKPSAGFFTVGFDFGKTARTDPGDGGLQREGSERRSHGIGAAVTDRVRNRLPDGLREQWDDMRLRGLPEPLRTVWPHTLLTPLNMLFLMELAERVGREGVPGDFVECGVYKGGSAGLLGHSMMRLPGPSRRLWLFDSFEGLPKATHWDGPLHAQLEGDYEGSEWQTRRILGRLGVPGERYEIFSGLFEATFARIDAPQVALLHLDCDFYEPVKLSLKRFYPRVSPGGYIVLNDYGTFPGCRAATDEFFADEGVEVTPTFIDRAAIFLQKPG